MVHSTTLAPAQPGIQWNCSAVSDQVLERMWKEEVMPSTHTGLSGANRGHQENLIQNSQSSDYCLNNTTSRIRCRLHHIGITQLPKFCVPTDPKIKHLSQQLFPEHTGTWRSYLFLNLGFGLKVISHGLCEVDYRNVICS
jgi:hypothetical protein